MASTTLDQPTTEAGPRAGSAEVEGAERPFYGCTILKDSYDVMEKLGEGTFGEVHQAKNRQTRQVVALKKIFHHNEKEGFPLTALREIKILKALDHENIIPLVDMSVEPGDTAKKQRGMVYMVTPYMDHDLCGLLQNSSVKLELAHIKCYMKQILEGIRYMHEQKYLHRDIKTANILIDNNGIVKLADFGLARNYNGDIPQAGRGAGEGRHRYTQMVVTRWYRPIELVLGLEKYTTAIDMWGIGCVFGEMFKRKPILPGTSDIDQGNIIFQLLGTPDEETSEMFKALPNAGSISFGPYRPQISSKFSEMDGPSLSLLQGLLTLNPLKRLTAVGALAHKFFYTDPLPSKPGELPKYSASHEMTSKNRPKDAPHAPNVDNFEHHHQTYDRDGSGMPGRHGAGGGGGWNGEYYRNYKHHNYHNRQHQHQQHPFRRGGGRGGGGPGRRRGGGGHGHGRGPPRGPPPVPPYQQAGNGPPPPPIPPYMRERESVEDHYDDDVEPKRRKI